MSNWCSVYHCAVKNGTSKLPCNGEKKDFSNLFATKYFRFCHSFINKLSYVKRLVLNHNEHLKAARLITVILDLLLIFLR